MVSMVRRSSVSFLTGGMAFWGQTQVSNVDLLFRLNDGDCPNPSNQDPAGGSGAANASIPKKKSNSRLSKATSPASRRS